MAPVHKYFLDKTALIASNHAHGSHVATALLSAIAMAESSELRLKEFLAFDSSDNETADSSDVPRSKRKHAQPHPKKSRAQPRPLSPAAKKQHFQPRPTSPAPKMQRLQTVSSKELEELSTVKQPKTPRIRRNGLSKTSQTGKQIGMLHSPTRLFQISYWKLHLLKTSPSGSLSMWPKPGQRSETSTHLALSINCFVES